MKSLDIKHSKRSTQTKLTMQVNDQSRDDEMLVHSLYKKLLKSWNNHNATDYANLFTIDANLIGFDGSQMNGRVEINNQISEIFSSHKVSSMLVS